MAEMRSKKEKQPAVVIPLDGSETAVRAFGTSEAVTRMLGGVLHVMHVSDQTVASEELPELLKLKTIEVEDFVIHQVSGHVVNTILEFALRIDACMIVMSSHGKTHDQELIAGGVTMEIVQHTDIPVLVVRPDMKKPPGPDWRPRKMLVPLNGSPITATEVDQVFSLAGTIGVDIDVLHVAVVGEARPAEVGAYTSPVYADYPHYDWSAWADEFLRRFGGRRSESKVRLFHKRGEIVDATLAFAEQNDEDLVALIWRGRLEKERAATVKGILQRAEAPVLLKRVKGGR